MSVLGYVLLATGRTHDGRGREIADGLKAVSGVEEVCPLFGEWDFIVKARADGHGALGDVTMRLRQVDGIVDSLTLVCVHPEWERPLAAPAV